jgi:hypothetical protein
MTQTDLKLPQQIDNTDDVYYADATNWPRMFIEHCIYRDKNSSLNLEDTYDSFLNWWKQHVGYEKSPTRKEMRLSLEKYLGKYDIDEGWKMWCLW